MAKVSTGAIIEAVRLKEMTTTPDTTGAGYSTLFAKSDGVYWSDDEKNEFGPFSTAGVGFSNPMTTIGALIYGETSGAAAELGIGTEDYVLTSKSGKPAWAEAASASGFATGDLHGVVLHEETLTTVGNFDVTTISQDYDHLIINCQLRSSVSAATDFASMFFNNDTTTSNYYSQKFSASVATVSAGRADNSLLADVPAASASANEWASVRAEIFNYTGNKLKTATVTLSYRTAADVAAVEMFHVGWESTAAISRITTQPDGYSTDKFDTGSYLQIIGYKTEA